MDVKFRGEMDVEVRGEWVLKGGELGVELRGKLVVELRRDWVLS